MIQLSPRLRQVLALVAEGLDNKEIGRELHISRHTARTHVGRLMELLVVRNRTQLVGRAYEVGLLVPADRSEP